MLLLGTSTQQPPQHEPGLDTTSGTVSKVRPHQVPDASSPAAVLPGCRDSRYHTVPQTVSSHWQVGQLSQRT